MRTENKEPCLWWTHEKWYCRFDVSLRQIPPFRCQPCPSSGVYCRFEWMNVAQSYLYDCHSALLARLCACVCVSLFTVKSFHLSNLDAETRSFAQCTTYVRKKLFYIQKLNQMNQINLVFLTLIIMRISMRTWVCKRNTLPQYERAQSTFKISKQMERIIICDTIQRIFWLCHAILMRSKWIGIHIGRTLYLILYVCVFMSE